MILSDTTKLLSVTSERGEIQLQKDIKTFSDRFWNSEHNKNWLIKCKAINLAPCTIWGLDQLGLNHLEITHLSGLVGKVICKLPTADVDFLNYLQDKFKIVFAFEEKQKGVASYSKAKLFDYCSDFTADGVPMRGSALLSVVKCYSK